MAETGWQLLAGRGISELPNMAVAYPVLHVNSVPELSDQTSYTLN
jgi:hypothetical protein